MIEVPFDPDLYAYMTRPPFEPVKYRHVKRGTIYTVISADEHQLNTFSEEGSMHSFVHAGQLVDCELQFSGEGKYAGPIVVYYGEDGKYWIRAQYEFFDGRFIKEEE